MEDPLQTLRRDVALINFHPNQLRGQHFLISQNIREKLTHLADLSENDHVIEIGPGTGIMSWLIAKKVSRLILIEIDPILAELLKNRFDSYQNVEVICEDGIQWLKGFCKLKHDVEWTFLSNLPYGISSPILFELMNAYPAFKMCVVLVQKEVAERVTAQKGYSSRGVLSVMIQARYHPQIMFDVSRHSFWPQPSIKSAALLLKPRNCIADIPLTELSRIVKILFKHKRKTVLNNFKKAFPHLNLAEMFVNNDVSANDRAENLSESQIVTLYNRLTQQIKDF